MIVLSKMCTLTPAVTILVSLACIITTVVIFGNSFILWKLNPLKSHNMRSHTRVYFDILLSYLALFDLLAAVTMVPRIYNELSCYKLWPFGNIGCKLVLPLYEVSLNISVCILIIISLERCRRIIMPFKKLNARTLHLTIIFSVMLSFAVNFERFVTANDINGACIYRRDSSILNISPLLVLLTRDMILLIVFTTTSVVVQRYLSEKSHQNIVNKAKKERSRRVYRMLSAMQILFGILVLPYDVISCISLSYVMTNKQNLPTMNM